MLQRNKQIFNGEAIDEILVVCGLPIHCEVIYENQMVVYTKNNMQHIKLRVQ